MAKARQENAIHENTMQEKEMPWMYFNCADLQNYREIIAVGVSPKVIEYMFDCDFYENCGLFMKPFDNELGIRQAIYVEKQNDNYIVSFIEFADGADCAKKMFANLGIDPESPIDHALALNKLAENHFDKIPYQKWIYLEYQEEYFKNVQDTKISYHDMVLNESQFYQYLEANGISSSHAVQEGKRVFISCL